MRRLLSLLLCLTVGVTALPRPARTADGPPEVGRLVRKLGSAEFDEREAAARALEKLGTPALDALDAAATDRDPEIRRRAAEVIERIETRHYGRPMTWDGKTLAQW